VFSAEKERYGSTKESRLARTKTLHPAWKLKEQGWQQKEIAEALGVTEGAVSQWMKRGRAGGEAALNSRPSQGAPSRLIKEQREQLLVVLAKGAEASGFRGEVWTAARVTEVIKRCFGVKYSRDHVGAILRKMRWSPQKPETKASQRDEEAIAAWKQEKWEEVKKSPRGTENPRLGRRGGVCAAASGRTNICSSWSDPYPQGQADI
jgi:transposase